LDFHEGGKLSSSKFERLLSEKPWCSPVHNNENEYKRVVTVAHVEIGADQDDGDYDDDIVYVLRS
jgi:hypothetical protein